MLPYARLAIDELRNANQIGDETYRGVEQELEWLELSTDPLSHEDKWVFGHRRRRNHVSPQSASLMHAIGTKISAVKFADTSQIDPSPAIALACQNHPERSAGQHGMIPARCSGQLGMTGCDTGTIGIQGKMTLASASRRRSLRDLERQIIGSCGLTIVTLTCSGRDRPFAWGISFSIAP